MSTVLGSDDDGAVHPRGVHHRGEVFGPSLHGGHVNKGYWVRKSSPSAIEGEESAECAYAMEGPRRHWLIPPAFERERPVAYEDQIEALADYLIGKMHAVGRSGV